MNGKELKALLERRIAVIEDVELREKNPEEQLNQLKLVSEQIDLFYEKEGAEMHPKLKHFMENKSLMKALDYLNEAGGSCH